MADKVDNTKAASSEKTIVTMIAGIKRSGVKLNDNIHKAAVMCLEHALNYGEVNRTAAKLVDALPLSHRRSLLINWFAAFSPVVLGKDNKTGGIKGHLKGTQEERAAMWNVEGAKATPFFAMPEAQREPDVPTYESIHNNVVSFISRMRKKADQIPNDEDKRKAIEEIEKLSGLVVNDDPAERKEIAFG